MSDSLRQVKIEDTFGDYIVISGTADSFTVEGREGETAADFEFDRDGVVTLHDALHTLLGLDKQMVKSTFEPTNPAQEINVAIIETAAKHEITISFRYSKSDNDLIESRTLVVNGHYVDHDGHFLVYGEDPDRDDDTRQFRLDRIKGYVTLNG